LDSDRKRRSAYIAVAEDESDMRSMVAEALRRDGHRVLEIPNGGDLLVRIARQYRRLDPAEPFDLLVSDVRTPVVTGLEILRGIRDAKLQMPVVLMTAFGDAWTRREAESLGAVLLDKPFALADLQQEVRRLLAA
jgi:CheY-like chemotaxis protein